MKKTKKALASLAIAGMALTMVPFNAFATGTVPPRLGGNTAAQTAVQIADQTGWTGTAILASSASYGMVDALTSGPLAKFLNAPILLQEPGAVLNADTKAELTKLAVKKVYVTSGTAVINQAVLDQLVGMGITVESLGGADRFETSVNIAKKMVALGAPVSKVAVAYGWLNQDALSIAAIASASNSPILLTEKNALPASVKAFLTSNITSSDVIGGTGVIADAVKAELPNATRHAGNTAYDTNNQVIQDFASSLTFGNVYVASGVTGIDALAGAPLAAMTKSPIVLTDGTVPAAAVFVHSKLATDSVVTALGGTAVVSDAVLAGVVSGVVTPPTGALTVTSVSAINATTVEVALGRAATAAEQTATKFTTTRTDTDGNVSNITMAATFSADGTKVDLSTGGNLMKGTYSVTATAGVTGTGSVTVKDREVGKIEILGTKMVQVSGTPTQTTVSYRVLDQYGADITKNALGYNVLWSSSVGIAPFDSSHNGTLTITKGANFASGDTATITGVDPTSGTTSTTTLSWVLAPVISSLTFGTPVLPSGATVIEVNKATAATIPLTVKDESGNELTDYNSLLVGGNAYIYTSVSNSAVALTYNKDADDKIIMNVDTTGLTVKETITINLIVKSTGKTYSTTINVVKAKEPAAISFGNFSKTVAAGDSDFVLPLVVTDQFGAILSADDMANAAALGSITFSSSNSAVINSTDLEIARGGSNKGSITLKTGSFIGLKGNTTISVFVPSTGKSANMTISVVEKRTPDALKLNGFKTNMIGGATQDFNADMNDQFGEAMTLDNLNASYTNVLGYYVKAEVTDVSGDTGALALNAVGYTADGVAIAPSVALNYNTQPWQLVATAGKVGTAKVLVTLWKENGVTDLKVSEISKTVSVAKNDVSGLIYSITDIPKLAGNTQYLATAGSTTAQARKIKVTAKDASGNEYAVPYSAIVQVQASNGYVNVGSDAGSFYVGGNNITAVGTFVGEKTANLTVTVADANGVQSIVKEVTVSTAPPTTQSITLVDKQQDGSYAMDAAAKTITDVNFANVVAAKAGITMYAYAKDQYGVFTAVNTPFIYADASQITGGTFSVNAGTNKFELAAGGALAPAAVNKAIYMSLFNGNGSATVKVTITTP